MQMHAALDLEHLPDSPYASELRRDFPDLRFSPELENEFQTFHLERVRSRVRFFQLAICALAIAEAIHLVVMDGVPLNDVLYGWLGVVVPVCLFLVWASWSSYYERIYLPVARVAVPAFAIASAMGVANRSVGAHPDQFYFLTTYSIALFFLGGQLFREALLATGAMVVACGATLAYTGEAAGSVIYYVVVLTITGAVGAFVYRGVERQLRISFLERGLMGEMVARDGLTGLKNRGAFDDYFPRMWQQALRCVAQVVQGFARRPLDIAARYGGEEFVLGLFDLSADSVRDMADQLRKSIHALSITHEDSPTALMVTASIGVAIVGPRIGRSPEGAVQVADEALYSAKRSGRNCVNVVDCDQMLFSTGTFRRSA